MAEALATRQVEGLMAFLDAPAMKAEIAKALGDWMTPERFIRLVRTMVQRTDHLADCTPLSLASACMEAAQLRLEPDNVLGQAYLVPFFSTTRKAYEASLIVGWRGYVTLALRSPKVSSIYAEIVHKADKFSLRLGTRHELVHVPKLDVENRLDPANWIGSYAVVFYNGGGHDFEFLTPSDIEAARSRSKAAESGPWVTDPEEMWKKTPIRRLGKRLPLETNHTLMRVAVRDEYRERGLEAPPDIILPGAPERGLPPEVPLAIVQDIDRAFEKLKYTQAQEQMLRGQFGQNLEGLAAHLAKELASRSANSREELRRGTPAEAGKAKEEGGAPQPAQSPGQVRPGGQSPPQKPFTF